MTLMVVAHPIPGFNGRVFADEVAMAFVGGFAVANVPTGVQADLTARGFTLNATPGTNYGGKYVLDADLDDAGSQASASLRAAYGLVFKADAATYGTNTTAATAHIQGLINAATAAGGGTVFIPAGRYKMTDQLVLPMCGVDSTMPQVNLVGAGRQSSKLIWATDLGAGKFGITFSDRASGPGSMSLGVIADLYLQGPAANNTVGSAPAAMSGIGNTARREIRGVRITGFYAGLCMTGDHTQFEHVNCGGNYYGLYADVANPALWGGWKFIDCQFNGNYAAGIGVSPNSSINGCLFQSCWIGYQPYGLLKESGTGSNNDFIIDTEFDKCGFELLGNSLARVAGTNGQILGAEWRRCYHSNDGSFKWAGQPSDAPFDCKILTQVKILAPEIGDGGWQPGDVAIFKATFFSQVIVEDPNGTLCSAVNSSGKVFASGAGDDFVKVINPGVWEGELQSLRDGTVSPNDLVSLLDNQVHRAAGVGIPYGVAMTGSSVVGTRIVVATRGQVVVNKDATVTGRNTWLKASSTAGKAGAGGAGDQIIGVAVDPVDGTAGTATAILRISSAPPPVFLDASMNGAGNGSAITQTLGGGSFATVTLDGATTDTVGGLNTTTHLYTVPYTGIYECSAKVRLTDDTAGGSQVGIGVHTSNADGPWFLWQMIDSEGSTGNMRKGFAYYRKAQFNAGDQLRLYVYSQSTLNLAQAGLTIQKVG